MGLSVFIPVTLLSALGCKTGPVSDTSNDQKANIALELKRVISALTVVDALIRAKGSETSFSEVSISLKKYWGNKDYRRKRAPTLVNIESILKQLQIPFEGATQEPKSLPILDQIKIFFKTGPGRGYRCFVTYDEGLSVTLPHSSVNQL